MGPAPDGADRLQQGMVGGVAAFRWAALAWLVTVQVVSRDRMGRPLAAVAFVAVALAWTVVATVLARRDPRQALAPAAVGSELVIGFCLLVADGWVYDQPHSQSLGSAWPLAGVLLAGIAWGWIGGGVAGVALGLGRVLATAVGDGAPASSLSLISTCVLYGQVGAVAGFVVRRLRDAEARISAARAREEVARTLHDGVLQTLAVVQRRADDPELAALARDQERELREYLFGASTAAADLVTELRRVAGRFERRHGARAEVLAVEEVGSLAAPEVQAIAGAVGEALTNAAKHGGASHVVVFVEPDDDEVFVSVKDDGAGFDPVTTPEGVGLARSIRGRLQEVGGRVEVHSRPGRGAEVRCWVPR